MQKQLALKIFIIFAVAIFTVILISFVKFKIYERSQYQREAQDMVESSWTGVQSIMTPILVIPYELEKGEQNGFIYQNQQVVNQNLFSNQVALISPDSVETNTGIETEYLNKGIYRIPVYTANVHMQGQFSREKIQQAMQKAKQKFDVHAFGQPYLSFYIKDVRGLGKAPEVTLNNVSAAAIPGSAIPQLSPGFRVDTDEAFLNTPLLTFDVAYSLRGTEHFSVVPAGDSVSTYIHSQWPHPEFIGTLLPENRSVSKEGFTADWVTTRFSSSAEEVLEGCVETGDCARLTKGFHGVRFIDPVDIYLQAERAVKYAILFVGLSFIAFFIFEHLKQIRIHPVQYTFVGFAIAVFYLLLVSLAEHIRFGFAYFIAVASCSSLLLFYVRYILHSFTMALSFFSMIIGLYGVLYVIIQAEDYALLMGAVLVFVILAMLMIVTRNMNWYELPGFEKPFRDGESVGFR